MNQVKYVLLDYKKRFGTIFVLVLLTITMLLIFSFSIASFSDSFASLNSLKKFENKSAFYTIDDTSDEKLNNLINDEQIVEKELGFFRQISNNYQYLMEYGYDIKNLNNGEMLSQRNVSESFFDLYGLKMYEGNHFAEQDYKSKKETVSVIVGYNLKEYYKVGNIYEFINGGTGENFKGKVIGVLNRNSKFHEFNYSDLSITLDNTYITPIFEDFNSDNMTFSDIDMALSHLVIFTNEIEKIKEQHFDINGFVTQFISCNDKIDDMLQIQFHNIMLFIGVLITIIIFIVFIFWITFNKIIKQQLKEYGIHILCGATNKDIFIRFVLFVSIIFLLANTSVFIINGLNLINIYSMIFSLFIAIVSLIYPYLKIKKLDVVSIMKN